MIPSDIQLFDIFSQQISQIIQVSISSLSAVFGFYCNTEHYFGINFFC